MILRTQELVFFILVLNTCITKFTIADDSDDSDDDRLQQALVLVDILKSEYIKALNENAILRENANNASEELSTCAATEEGNFSLSDSSIDPKSTTMPTTDDATVLTSSSQSPLTDSYPKPLSIVTAVPKLPVYHEPQPLHPYYQQGPPILTQGPLQNLPPVIPMAPHFYGTTWPPNYPTPYADERQMPYRPYRRMIPRDYYYFDNPMNRYDNTRMGNLPFFFRRMQNRAENENGTIINSSTVTTQPTISRTPRSSVTKSTRIQNDDQFKTTFKKKKIQTELPIKKKRWRNPILNQVAEELIKEIGVASSSNKNTSYLKKRQPYKNPKLRSTSEKNKTKKLDHQLFTKTTLRIHMEGSTRLALPLSENNAYCFFSPKSALCRSSI